MTGRRVARRVIMYIVNLLALHPSDGTYLPTTKNESMFYTRLYVKDQIAFDATSMPAMFTTSFPTM